MGIGSPPILRKAASSQAFRILLIIKNMDKEERNIEAVVGVAGGKQVKYKTKLTHWLSKDLVFEKIVYAKFSDSMVMAVVQFDKDHCIYVLVPEDIFSKEEDLTREFDITPNKKGGFILKPKK